MPSSTGIPKSHETVAARNAQRGIRAAQAGMLINACLAAVKLAAGILGNTYALVADAVESAADAFASLIVWSGLAIAARPADEDHPFGHGKAEALAAAIVSMLLLGAAAGIAIQAVREIRTPHRSPAAWTLLVLVVVVIAKWILARRVHAVGGEIASTAVEVDAAHHLSDAITSAAAFIGISVAILGSRFWGGRWESADDWAALVASGVIAYNGLNMLRASSDDLMDRAAGDDVIGPIRRAATNVPGVLAIEKLHVRKTGMSYQVMIHVQVAPTMPLDIAHALGGQVKQVIRDAVHTVEQIHLHMEPYYPEEDVEATR